MSETTVNGVKTAYRIEQSGKTDSPKDLPWVIMLNGIGMTMSHWIPVVEAMHFSARILLLDFRGQLMSGRPGGEYSLELHAHDLSLLMDELDIDSAHLVGTSYGSEVAMEFALGYPSRCRSLVIIDGVSELDAVLETAVDSWRIAAETDPRVFYRSLIPWNYSAGYIESHRDILRQREDAVAGLPEDYFQAFVRLCDAFLKIDITPRLAQISCPTLVTVGELDILKHRGFAEIIYNNIPGSVMRVFAGAAHAVVIEAPGAVSSVCDAFLSRL